LDRLLLLLLLPPALQLMLVIAALNLAVFRDPRKVFFLQDRIGWRGRPFRIIKFRTMNEAPTNEVDSWADGSDRLRVTPLGRLLRNSHLDEVPQIFNILLGEMSFIGPRPEMSEVEAWASAEIPGFGERLAIRPGIAGLAQVTQGYTGRDVDAYREKLEINRRYMGEMGLFSDLIIVLRTMIWMVLGKGWSWNQSGRSRLISPLLPASRRRAG
jgi:lipopolysaccharide/colanic/teichoic acid biosynthesis glycosyltransferase